MRTIRWRPTPTAVCAPWPRNALGVSWTFSVSEDGALGPFCNTQTMIKKIIDKLLGKRSTQPALGKRREIGASEHGIDPSLVDKRAIDVVQTLQDAGYEAYIVGGAVRDLLLGLRPKDFDVATDATPEQVKSLFRRAFIIGRRFRIV